MCSLDYAVIVTLKPVQRFIMTQWKQACWLFHSCSVSTKQLPQDSVWIHTAALTWKWLTVVKTWSTMFLSHITHTHFSHKQLSLLIDIIIDLINLTWAWLDPFCFTQSSLVSICFLLLLSLSGWISPSLTSFHLHHCPLQLARREQLDSAAKKSVLRAG